MKEIEDLSYRVAKSNPEIRTWFIQAESRGKFHFLMDKDYALDIEMIRRLLHTAAPKADAVAG